MRIAIYLASRNRWLLRFLPLGLGLQLPRKFTSYCVTLGIKPHILAQQLILVFKLLELKS
jgi:hypothetical protein